MWQHKPHERVKIVATKFKNEKVSSVLKLDRVVFNEVSFKRLGFKQAKAKTSFGLGRNIEKIADGKYQVSLSVKVDRDNEYEALVSITGYCEIDEADPQKDTILKENTIAILFPYARAELTLITAQPETEPLVLPAVNIKAMLDEAEKKKE